MLLSKSKYDLIDIENIVNEKLSNRKIDELLFIVPTNRKVRALNKYFLDNSKDNAVSNLRIHTLSTLSTLLFKELVNGEYFILDDATAIIKLKKIFSELELSYFPKNQEITQGILLELKNIISEFKRKGISAELLEQDLELLSGSEKNKAEDLIKIFKRYQSECFDKKLYELGDFYSFITKVNKENFKTVFRENFQEVNAVIIMGFDELTTLEIKIIDSICDLIQQSFIKFDIEKENGELFSYPLKTVNKLKNIGFNEIPERENILSNSFIGLIRKNLFTIKPETQESDIKLKLFSAQNRIDEISFIAKIIKKYITDFRYNADDICVAFNQISNYSDIINEVFDDYGLPFNLTDRFLLSNSSPVISVINLLEILENNFYYKNIFRALSGEWISIPEIDKNNLLNVSVNLKIVAGLDNWERKIDNVIEELEANPESEFNYLPKESYIKAKEDILKIADILKPFNYKLTPEEFLKRINDLINQLGLLLKTVNNSQSQIEKNIRGLLKFIEMLHNIIEILEIEYGKQKHTLGFYLEQIKAAAQFTRFNIKEKPGVLVTSIDEIRGLNFKVLLLGGLVDGEFPTKYSPEVFIPHKYKVLEDGHISKERYKFYQALSDAIEQIILTYPQNEDNTDLTISSFLNDLISVVKFEELERNDVDSMICSVYELKKNMNIKSLAELDSQTLSQININLSDLRLNCEFDFVRRNTPFSESEFNGYLSIKTDNHIQKYFEEFAFQQNYSSSKLEDYVKCPFQFLLKRVLNLQPFKEPVEEVESFEIGTLIHSILYEFYSVVKEKNIIVENCTDTQFEELTNLIFEIAERKIKKESFSNAYSFFELEKILGINGIKQFSVLYKFLEEERKPKNGFKPIMFEKKFGKFSDSPKVQISGINLQGSIDRIDVNEEEKLFSVIDYKLRGKTITKEDINEGISLQLPLYLFAAKSLLEAEFNQNYEPYSAEIYSLNIFRDEFKRKIIHNSNSRNLGKDDLVRINNDMIDIFSRTVEKSVEKIKNGEFNLSTLKDRENKVCSYCDFISVCRVQEII